MAPKTAKKPAKKTARKTTKKIAKKTARKTAKKTTKKKKAKRVSKIAKGKRAKSSVFRGTKTKTSGGLTKDKLIKNKNGKVVSKAASASSKKRYAKSGASAWAKACSAARSALKIKGFCAIGGKSAQGKALYAKAKSLYKK